MNSYQAMLIIDDERGNLTLEDVKYMNNKKIQLLRDKIGLLCFKYLANDDINFKMDYNNEFLDMIKDLKDDEKNYLTNYRSNLLKKLNINLFSNKVR